MIRNITRYKDKIFIGISLVLLSYITIELLMWVVLRLWYPYQLDYGEGTVLAFVSLLAQGKSYFTPITEYPFIHGAYPPIFIVLSLPFYLLFGPSLASTRLVSILSTVILMYFLYRLLYHITNQKIIALIYTVLFGSHPLLRTWALEGRVDMTAIMFSFIGLFEYYRLKEFPHQGLKRALPWFVLALFTKHNALLAPAAVIIDAFFYSSLRKKDVIQVVLTHYILPILVLVLIGQIVTHGQFLLHLISYTAVPFYVGWLKYWYIYFLKNFWPFLLITSIGILLSIIHKKGTYRLFIFYFVLNILAVASMAKDGASPNYLLEPWLATIVCMAASIGLIDIYLKKRYIEFKILSISFITIVLVMWQISIGYWPPNTPLSFIKGIEYSTKENKQLAEIINQAPGDILSENMTILIENHRPVLLEPFQFKHLAYQEIWNPAPLIEDCKHQRFSVIIDEWRIQEIPGMKDCIQKYYYKDEGTIQKMSIFRPISILPTP